jgi:phospholipase D1/2
LLEKASAGSLVHAMKEAMTKLLRVGETAWRIAHADRVAFLVDGENYYRAAAHAMKNAKHSIFLLGWDMNSKVELLRGDDRDDLPAAIGPRLGALLRRNKNLQVCLLDWDFPVLLSQERESRWRFRHRWPASRRFHLHYDAAHPTGASHHQKILLVDDSLVICGGMDIGVGRWDTSEHRAVDERRSDAGFPDYVPAHDIMAMADGEVARAMADLVRDRWRRATGEEAPAPFRQKAPAPFHEERCDCWPDVVEPSVTDVDIGISRTMPPMDDEPGVFEVERLYVDAIGAAKRWLYIENQYLTSDVVVTALCARLREENGPDIVIALPQNNFGWFEARTIQVLHFRCIGKMRRADVHGRLRVCYPRIPDLGDKQVNLHSKIMVVDDDFVRIGSSNMNNRSMRLDTECDFSIEALGEGRVRTAIARFRNQLLAEHLCLSLVEVEEALARHGSLAALVDEREQCSRCLGRVDPVEGQEDADFGSGYLVDPKEPLSPEVVIEAFSAPDTRRLARPRLARLAVMLGVFVLLAAAWRWTPLAAWLDPEVVEALGSELRGHPAAPLLVLAIYVVSAFVVLPVTVLIVATASVFGPWLGIAYSLAGSLASAMTMFSLGRLLGRGSVETLTGGQFRRIAESLKHRGLPTMIVLRMLPIAPFTVVNLVVGASGIAARDFALGTVIGMAPGTVSLCVFQAQLLEAVRHPDAKNLVLLAVVAAGIAGSLAWLRGRLRAKRRTSGPPAVSRLVPRQG